MTATPSAREIIADLKRHGLSSGDIGTSIGAGRGAIQSWSRGKVTPPADAYARLARLARSYKQMPAAGLMSTAELPKGGPT